MVSNLRTGAWLLSVHAWFLRTQTQVCVRMSLVRNAILTPVSFVSYPNAILTPFFHPFIEFAPIFRQGSTNCVATWYKVFTTETKAHICAAGFELIIYLLLERSTSAIVL